MSGVVPILGVGAGNFTIRIPILICWVADRKEYIRDNGRTNAVSSAAFISHKYAVLSSLTADTKVTSTCFMISNNLAIGIRQIYMSVKSTVTETTCFLFFQEHVGVSECISYWLSSKVGTDNILQSI